MKKPILFVAFLMAGFMASAQLTVAGFTNYNLHGFNVLVKSDALSQHATQTQRTINYLDTLLVQVNELGLASDILDSLHRVPIFMEYALTTGSAWYHYDVNWLIANGYNPAKARCVEITNVNNFYNWSKQNQPWVIMHELAHAYNDRVLGTSYAPIVNAYNAAMSGGIYNSVPYNPGNGGAIFNREAYAKSNYLEYFAEITEAYLGTNDYFAFDSTDLKTFDPPAYQLTKSIWRFASPAAIEDPLGIFSLQAFPNPANDLVLILADHQGPMNFQLVNMQGQVVQSMEVNMTATGVELPLHGLAAGVYMLRCLSGGKSDSVRLVKS